jgi:hypothetical protein
MSQLTLAFSLQPLTFGKPEHEHWLGAGGAVLSRVAAKAGCTSAGAMQQQAPASAD